MSNNIFNILKNHLNKDINDIADKFNLNNKNIITYFLNNISQRYSGICDHAYECHLKLDYLDICQ